MNFPFTPFQLEWLAALKSGKFAQTGAGQLCHVAGHNRFEYCCLGVACEIACDPAIRAKIGNLPELNRFERGMDVIYGKQEHWLPLEMAIALNLRDTQGKFAVLVEYKSKATGKTRHYAHLGEMNDNYVPFAEIAAYIESNPENVFTNK